MKPYLLLLAFFIAGFVVARKTTTQDGYILTHEKDIAINEPGPHDGGGNTTAYGFFKDAPGFKLAFRKRVLHPGATIGYHLQETDEIYYILEGKGEMTMNGKTFPVEKGDAILTRPGNSHGLKPIGNQDLVVLINYALK